MQCQVAGGLAYHLNLLSNAYLTFEEGYPRSMKCPQNCPPRKSFVSLLSEFNHFLLYATNLFRKQIRM